MTTVNHAKIALNMDAERGISSANGAWCRREKMWHHCICDFHENKSRVQGAWTRWGAFSIQEWQLVGWNARVHEETAHLERKWRCLRRHSSISDWVYCARESKANQPKVFNRYGTQLIHSSFQYENYNNALRPDSSPHLWLCPYKSNAIQPGGVCSKTNGKWLHNNNNKLNMLGI